MRLSSKRHSALRGPAWGLLLRETHRVDMKCYSSVLPTLYIKLDLCFPPGHLPLRTKVVRIASGIPWVQKRAGHRVSHWTDSGSHQGRKKTPGAEWRWPGFQSCVDSRCHPAWIRPCEWMRLGSDWVRAAWTNSTTTYHCQD